MRSPLRCALACFGVACFVSVGSVRADFTLVDDGFELTTHPSGFRTVATSPGIPFYMGRSPDGSNTALLTTDNTAGFTGTVFSINGSTAAATNFPAIGLLPTTALLTTVGDTLTLSFSFRFTNSPSMNQGAFRFGLFDSNGTSLTADGPVATTDNDRGYYAMVGSAGSLPGSGNVLFVENGGVSPILGGTDRVATTANNNGVSISDNLVHTVSLTLTRTSLTAMGMSTTIDSTTTTGSFVTLWTSFDEIGFGNTFAATNTQFNIDNVKVTATSVIPEPSTVALCGLAAIGLGLGRRRRVAAIVG